MAKKAKSAVSQFAKDLGQRGGEMARAGGKNLAQIPVQGTLGFAQGLGEGLLGSKLGGHLGVAGALGYGMHKLNNALSLTDQFKGLMSGGIEGRNKVMADKATRDWRKKVKKNLVPTTTFEMGDLVNHSKNMDAGIAETFKTMDKKKYETAASEAIKSNNPTALYDMIIREAQSKGKKVNLSKPFFLPNVFNKDGKKYAYAIDASETDDEGNPNVRFIPVPIGGKPFEEPEE